MVPILKKSIKITDCENFCHLAGHPDQLDPEFFSIDEFTYIQKRFSKEQTDFFVFNRLSHLACVAFIKPETDAFQRLEKCRQFGDRVAGLIQEHRLTKISIHQAEQEDEALAFAEGIALGNYQFLRYKSDQKGQSPLKEIRFHDKNIAETALVQLSALIEAVYHCRDLVNEPLNTLSAVKLAETLETMGKAAGVKVEVLSKIKIESLKMGGLLAVNRGSIEPPTFTIMEWKPRKPVNSRPMVLVGKGVVFDTGGMNLKSYEGMLSMKEDMAGAAAAGCVVTAVAKAGLPVHVIALIPATENRPDGNAMVPGDILYMHDGTTVEVLNTDAEGRLILADALSYAKRYDPELVIDLATLTGSAAVAIGKQGMVGMHQKAESEFNRLCTSGFRVHERIAAFPFWEEYGEMIRSEVADLKNIGGREGGVITAGKFLAHFTSYPFIHLDIAGLAFRDKKDSYRSGGGTAVGVRLLFDFFRQMCL